jgi:hypothetical protein
MHAVQVQVLSAGGSPRGDAPVYASALYTKQQKHSLFQPGNKGDKSPETGVLATSFVCGGNVEVLSQ